MESIARSPFPGDGLESSKMPGHWVLARLGKRVLRPGGRELTRRMIDALDIGSVDHVVEFAPGLGATAALAIARNPASYTGIERDGNAARRMSGFLSGPHRRCIAGRAEESGLPDGAATVVYGEAMLSMQPDSMKERIFREAFRLLAPGGRYALHELALIPDRLDEPLRRAIQDDLTRAIHVGVRPMTAAEWTEALEAAGFRRVAEAATPMRLLEPLRVIRDEGWIGTARFAGNLLRNPAARSRVRAMREVFRRHGEHLGAVMLVGAKAPLD